MTTMTNNTTNATVNNVVSNKEDKTMVVLMDVVAKVAPEVALVKCSAEDAVWVAECMYKHEVPSDVMARAVEVAGSVAELKAYIVYATEKFASINPAVWGGSLATKIAAVAM